MNYAFVSNGSGLALVKALEKEGHQVKVHIPKEYQPRPYAHGVTCVNTMGEALSGDDTIIVFDHVGRGVIADKLAARYRVIGSTHFTDQLDSDFEFGTDMFKAAGIKAAASARGTIENPLTMRCVMWFENGNPVFPAMSRINQVIISKREFSRQALTWMHEVKEPKIVQVTFKKAFPILNKVKFTGMMAIDVVISTKTRKLWAMSWNCSIDATLLLDLSMMLDCSVHELLTQTSTYLSNCRIPHDHSVLQPFLGQLTTLRTLHFETPLDKYVPTESRQRTETQTPTTEVRR